MDIAEIIIPILLIELLPVLLHAFQGQGQQQPGQGQTLPYQPQMYQGQSFARNIGGHAFLVNPPTAQAFPRTIRH